MALDRIQLCDQLWLELLIETLTSQKIRYYSYIALKLKICVVFWGEKKNRASEWEKSMLKWKFLLQFPASHIDYEVLTDLSM